MSRILASISSFDNGFSAGITHKYMQTYLNIIYAIQRQNITKMQHTIVYTKSF